MEMNVNDATNNSAHDARTTAGEASMMFYLLSTGSDDLNKDGLFDRQELQAIIDDGERFQIAGNGAQFVLDNFDDIRQFATSSSLKHLMPDELREKETTAEGVSKSDLAALYVALVPENENAKMRSAARTEFQQKGALHAVVGLASGVLAVAAFRLGPAGKLVAVPLSGYAAAELNEAVSYFSGADLDQFEVELAANRKTINSWNLPYLELSESSAKS